MATGKKYGLIIPNAKNALFAKKNGVSARPSVFGNDSSSDEDAHKEVNAQIHREALKKKIQKQTKIEIQKALEQDSTVYEYDSIYDDMKEKSKKKVPANVAKADKQRKPKYIGNLIKAAEKRAKEKERIEERKIQKEREKEGDEFNDKEEFVTSAYRQKMLERQQEIEEEKRMDAIEEALDVRKQRDLTGFYRNFLNRELCEEPNEGDSDEPVKKALEEPNMPHNQDDEDTDMSFSSDEDQQENNSSSPKRRQSPIVNREHSSSQRQTSNSHGRSNERVSHKRRTKDRDSRTYHERRSRSPEHRHQSRQSPSRRSSPSRKRDRDKDKHSRRRSHERDRRSPHGSHQQGRQGKEALDERSRKRDRSRDRRHRKRQKRRDRDRSRSRSSSRSPNRSKDSEPTDGLSKRQDEQSDAGPRAMSADVSAEHKVEGPIADDKPTNSFAKRTDKDKASSARERYLARKAAQQAKPAIDSD